MIVALVLLNGLAAAAQTVTITATKIYSDAFGTPVAKGQACLQATTAAGVPIAFAAAGGGQVGVGRPSPKCVNITNGAFTMANVPDALASSPTVCYAFFAKDSSSGAIIIGDPNPQQNQGYACLQPTNQASAWCVSGQCNLDNYAPNLANAGVAQTVLPAGSSSSLSLPANAPVIGTDGSGNPIANAGTLPNNISGNAATATAFPTTPSQCNSNQVSTGIAANGNANCITWATGVQKISSNTAVSSTAGVFYWSTCTSCTHTLPTTVPPVYWNVVISNATGSTITVGSASANIYTAASGTSAVSSVAVAANQSIYFTTDGTSYYTPGPH